MSFVWNNAGSHWLKHLRTPANSSDFSIRRNGENTWGFYHWTSKNPCATFTGENATQALKALKLALITARLMK